MEELPRILLLGIGAIGGIISSRLINGKKCTCTLITNNPIVTTEIKLNGLLINDVLTNKSSNIVPNKIFTNITEVTGSFDYIFFMMKAKDVDKAIQQAKCYLKPDGYIVTFQNGILYEKYYQFFGCHTIIATVLFNSIMTKPGNYTLSRAENIVIGSPYPIESRFLQEVQFILSDVTECIITDNILGTCWTKLAINCAINALTAITGKPLGQVLKKNLGKESFFAIIREVIDIADALGIKLAKLKFDPYLLYQDDHTPFYKKCIQLIIINQIEKNYATIYPSMLQDIKKNKITEVEYLNGYVSKLGQQLQIPTPTNDEMVSLIKKIESNLLKPDVYLLKIAYDIPLMSNNIHKNEVPL